uniref:Uncharacterized protein n=1 Tax=Anopheles atroparvus TaxID=41427 RepID=A0A182JG66_ANOAO
MILSSLCSTSPLRRCADLLAGHRQEKKPISRKTAPAAVSDLRMLWHDAMSLSRWKIIFLASYNSLDPMPMPCHDLSKGSPGCCWETPPVYSESQAQISTKNNTPSARDKLALQLDTGKAQPRLRTRHRSSVDVSDSAEAARSSNNRSDRRNALAKRLHTASLGFDTSPSQRMTLMTIARSPIAIGNAIVQIVCARRRSFAAIIAAHRQDPSSRKRVSGQDRPPIRFLSVFVRSFCRKAPHSAAATHRTDGGSNYA